MRKDIDGLRVDFKLIFTFPETETEFEAVETIFLYDRTPESIEQIIYDLQRYYDNEFPKEGGDAEDFLTEIRMNGNVIWSKDDDKIDMNTADICLGRIMEWLE